MYQIVTVTEIGGYQFFVPTDYYRHAESSSGCSTKRLARTCSGGGETVTLANGDGTWGNYGKRDIDNQ